MANTRFSNIAHHTFMIAIIAPYGSGKSKATDKPFCPPSKLRR